MKRKRYPGPLGYFVLTGDFAPVSVGRSVGFVPRHALDLPPEIETDMGFSGDHTFTNGERLVMCREEALQAVAERNGQALAKRKTHPDDVFYWSVVIEFAAMPAWWFNVELFGYKGTADVHQLEFRIVKPTAKERKQFGTVGTARKKAVAA